MNWRPEGWKNPYTSYSEKQLDNLVAFVKTFGKKETSKFLRNSLPLHKCFFEEGADAMLEVLKKEGKV